MYTKILVPMESEEQQEPAVSHACRLARHSKATVILAWLVPVADSSEHFFKQIQVEPGSSGARRKAEGEAYLARAEEELRASGVNVTSKVVITPLTPEEAIVETAIEDKVDLIIMATLPQSAVGRFLFGSVGDKVRRRSPIPVLFVRPSQVDEREISGDG